MEIFKNFGKVKYQCFATVCANLVILCYGYSFAWISPAVPILQSKETPLLQGQLTLDEISWIGSLLAIGLMISIPFVGLLIKYVGNKKTLIILAIPCMVSWIIVIYAEYTWHLYIARICIGLTAGGGLVCMQLFVAEISDKSVRGVLGSLLSLNFSTGILLGYLAGTYLNYFTVPLVGLGILVIFLISFIPLPNTPQYLLQNGKTKEAEKALKFYKNYKNTSEDCAQIKEDMDNLNAVIVQNLQGKALRFADVCKAPYLKPFLIGPTLMAINMFSGSFAIVGYAATIFKESGSDIDPNTSSIVIGVIQIFGIYCSTILIERIGRKALLLISLAGIAICMAAMGVYSYLAKHEFDVSEYSLVPVISLSLEIFTYSIGVQPVPYIITTEVLPQEMRNLGAITLIFSNGLFSFIVLKAFPILSFHLELYGCMWLFSAVSIVGIVYVLFVVYETKGTEINSIENK